MTDKTDAPGTPVPDEQQPAPNQPAPDAQTPAPDQPAPSDDRSRQESVVTRLMRRGRAEADALLEALGMREELSSEAADLARLVERKLAHSAWGSHEEALDQLEIQRAFLAHRFIAPMKSFERGDRFYAYLDTFLNLTSIVAGIGASLAAALNAPKVYAIVFGLIVGFLQSLSQWLKPSQRSARRGLAAAALRNEAWSFLQDRDRYRGKDDRAAWALFADQIERVEQREQADEDKEARQQPVARAPGRP